MLLLGMLDEYSCSLEITHFFICLFVFRNILKVEKNYFSKYDFLCVCLSAWIPLRTTTSEVAEDSFQV